MPDTSPSQLQLEAEYKLFTDAIERHIPTSPSAKKPALVLGGSSAGLVGSPLYQNFCFAGHLANADGWWMSACKSCDLFVWGERGTHPSLLSSVSRVAYRALS